MDYPGKIPEKLQKNISIDIPQEDNDTSQGTLDGGDNVNFGHFMFNGDLWYVGEFRDKVSGDIHCQAYYGKECMIVGVREKLCLTGPEDYISKGALYFANCPREDLRKEAIKIFLPIAVVTRYELVDLYSYKSLRESLDWRKWRKSCEEKKMALREKRLTEIPKVRSKEGQWIKFEIQAYKDQKRTNTQMEELMHAMTLSPKGSEEFKRRCGWRE
jgi:Fe-S-cluster containining protein